MESINRKKLRVLVLDRIIKNKLKCYINCAIKNEEHISNEYTMGLVLDKKYIQIKIQMKIEFL